MRIDKILSKHFVIGFSIVSVFYLVNCDSYIDNCPETISVIHDVLLSDSTLRFPQTAYVEEISYQDSLGSRKCFEYKTNRYYDSTKLIALENCRALFQEHSLPIVFYSSEWIEIEYESDSGYSFRYELFVNNYYKPSYNGDTLLFDQFNLTGSINRKNVPSTNVVTSYRGNNELIDMVNDSYIYIQDTTLLGKDFTDIYMSPDSKNRFLFKPKSGVIAFIENGNPWVIEN